MPRGSGVSGQPMREMTVREHVEKAHHHIRMAQDKAYRTSMGKTNQPLRVRLALNRAQSVLIKLLVHRLPVPSKRSDPIP